MSKKNPNALPKGTQLGAYTIREVLGSGGFGITYRATSPFRQGNITQTHQFAIKEYYPELFCSRIGLSVKPNPGQAEQFNGGKADFKGEAEKLHGLGTQERHIVKVNEVFEANGTVYYVMQYVEGESLTDAVPRGGMSYAEAISLLTPIINAVGFLHAKLINHLDIKPDNIMISSDGQCPVLIDFGQSIHFKSSGGGTSPKKMPGATDGFAPPEQYAGITRFSPRSDIYALAATLCFMLTGRAPAKSTELKRAEIEEMLRDKHLSADQIEAIVRAMQPASHERTDSIDQLKLDLRIEDKSRDDSGGGRPTDPIDERITIDRGTIRKVAIGVAVVAVVVCLIVFLPKACGESPSPKPPQKDTTENVEPIVVQPVIPVTPAVINPPEPEPVTHESESPQLVTPTVSTGRVSFAYGYWEGGVKNGKPEGQGRMTYTSSHIVSDKATAEAGDYMDASYSGGKLEIGDLYDSHGVYKETIVP